MKQLVAGLVALCVSGVSMAQSNSSVDVQHFKPTPDADALFTVDSAEVEPHLGFDLGLSFNFVKDPLVLRRKDGFARAEAFVDRRLDMNLLASIGLFDFLEAGLDVPLVVHQAGFNNLGLLPSQPAQQLSSLGAGDIRLMLKAALLKEEKHGISLAVLPILSIPSGKEFTGAGGVGVVPELLLGRRFGPVRLAANLGFRFQPGATLNDLGIGNELVWKAGGGLDLEELGTEVPLELIAEAYGLVQAAEPFARREQTPAEGLFGARYRLLDGLAIQVGGGRGLTAGYGAPAFRVFAGVAFAPQAPKAPADRDRDGLADAVDQCPDEPGTLERDGCPLRDRDGDSVEDDQDACPDEKGLAGRKGCPVRDRDRDTVEDDQDRCPDEKGLVERAGCPIRDRDQDTVEDEQDACPDEKGLVERKGCPFRDADGDGVEDGVDACPNEKGLAVMRGCPVRDVDEDGVADNVDNCPKEKGPSSNQGCPVKKKQLVVITKQQLEIKQKVFFATNKATILRKSHGLLDQVADVILSHEEVCPIRVEGHTDSRGSADLNRRLSQQRADAVRAYLEKRGVKRECLKAVGHGPDKPIGDNKTGAGREQNRRVEFRIESAETETTAAGDQPKATPASATDEDDPLIVPLVK